MNYYCDVTIGSQFVPAWFNDDVSGLTDEEVIKFTDWEKGLVESYCGHVTLSEYPDGDGIEEFVNCEITGLMGRCETFMVYVESSEGS